VVNDANFQTPVAPGSYVAIFGANLSAYSDPPHHVLPLAIDAST